MNADHKTAPETRSIQHFAVPVLCALLGLAGLMLNAPDPVISLEYKQQALSAVVLGFGIWAFWKHGNHQVTGAGAFSLAMAVFVGFAGLWIPRELGGASSALLVATAICFYGHLFLYLVFWSRPASYHPLRSPTADDTKWGMIFGLLITVVGLTLLQVFSSGGTQVTLLGLTIFMVSMVLHPSPRVTVPFRLLLVGLIIVIAAVTIFSAFGRLRLVALGLSVIVTASALGLQKVKVWTVLGIPPILSSLVVFRESMQRDIGHEEDGLGSVLAPLVTFARLIEEGIESAGLETFLATLTWWVPREVWGAKPVGLGSAIANELEPEAASRGHSMAASGFGEWYFYLGWLGVLGFIVWFGLAVRWLDSWLAGCTLKPIDSRERLLIWVALSVLVSELPAIAWSGTFTYSTRAGIKLLLLAAVIFIFAKSGRKLSPAGAARATG